MLPEPIEGISVDAIPEMRLTDLGNAERLVRLHGRDLRHVRGVGWVVWDGRRWRRDQDGEVERRQKASVRAMYAEAAALDDSDERKRLAAFAARCEGEARIRAAISLAESERPVLARVDELDADLWLLNVANGVVDLRTSELRAHERADLMTKLAPTVYDPDARSPLWDGFVERCSGGDPELAAFLARAAGYSLTGSTAEEVLFFAHGPTATGKSTFLEALKAALGEYARVADFESFLARAGDAGIRNDVARLAGARLVVSVEVDEGKRLAEGLLKMLTGGDTVTARFLYSEAFEFRPMFKLWLAANARPKVNAGDEAMWRRILQVPFTETIPERERDPELKRRLRVEPEQRSAILAWAVRGCLDWQARGLAIPDAVRAYTAEYRAENDPLREFVETCCHVDSAATVTASELRAAYEAWAGANGERPIGNSAYGAALKARGCDRFQLSRGVKGWRGITLDRDRQAT